ncbi:MAG TPA: hypothetical protein VIW47_13600 [Nitrospiraceae bacterium]
MKFVLGCIGAFALGVVFGIQPVLAQANPRRREGPPLTCTQLADLNMKASQLPSFKAPGQREGEGSLLAIVGVSVPIDGSKSRLRIYYDDCPQDHPDTVRVPHFAWTLDKPPGSTAVLENVDSLKVSFKPDIPGDYTAHLVGCPDDAISKKTCLVHLNNRPKAVQLLPEATSVKVTVSVGGQLSPLYTPGNVDEVATVPQHYATARNACDHAWNDFSIGVLRDPEWYTTKVWNGPTPAYELAEGRVYHSNIAGADNPYAHIDNDHNAQIELDPHYRNLLVDDSPEDKTPNFLPFGGLEIEWEFPDFPDAFRPIEGDRMSVLGYHIVDCGHEDYHTEIHPPIAVAVHRPRAVKLPEKFQYARNQSGNPVGPVQPIGSNVYVPGIVTDIWVNLNGGMMLDRVAAGLHQPSDANPSVGQPTTAGVQFRFKVYLPPSPTFLLKQVMSVPFEPALFVQVQDHPLAASLGAATPLPIKEVERHLDGPSPYLLYTLALSPLSPGERYAKRIVAAWVYPDLTGQNFGLHAYRVKLEQMKVLDTGNATSGNWKLWATLPSVDAPWTKLIECRSCIDSKTYGPGADIWQRGAMDSVGHLMGEILVFQPTGDNAPSQTPQLRLTGYDNDWLSSDAFGDALSLVTQVGRYNTHSVCDPDASCPSFSIVYSVDAGTAQIAESLDPAAKAAYQGFLLHPTTVVALAKPVEVAFHSATMTAQRAGVALKTGKEDMKRIKKLSEPSNLHTGLQKGSATERESFVKALRERMIHFLARTLVRNIDRRL